MFAPVVLSFISKTNSLRIKLPNSRLNFTHLLIYKYLHFQPQGIVYKRGNFRATMEVWTYCWMDRELQVSWSQATKVYWRSEHVVRAGPRIIWMRKISIRSVQTSFSNKPSCYHVAAGGLCLGVTLTYSDLHDESTRQYSGAKFRRARPTATDFSRTACDEYHSQKVLWSGTELHYLTTCSSTY